MNIKTKYNIWDTVWTVKDNKAYSFEINKIEIIPWVITSDKIILYSGGNVCDSTWIDVIPRNYKYNEHQLVWSREELINLL